MSKISYSVMKKLKLERLLKRQANFDHVIVFDEEFEMKYNHIDANRNYWLTFVDFCSTYKYDPNGSCLKTASYTEIVNKMNEWIRQLPQYRFRDRLQSGQPIWTIINCETLYAKISLSFAENGEITRKRVMQFSKWPLNDELFMNLFCEGNTMTQNFEQIFNGRYIVILLRLWMTKQPYYPLMFILPPPTIAIKDYWPKKTIINNNNHPFSHNNNNNNNNNNQIDENNRKTFIKTIEFRKKLRRTLSIEGANNDNHNNVQQQHNYEPKVCLEKIQHITKRINNDIINNKIHGRIINVVTFPSYYYKDCNSNNNFVSDEPIIDVGGKISSGHIVNLIRVFYAVKPICEYEQDITQPKELIDIIDFVPRCISGGGFIKYPRFETQTDIIDKATMWMTKHSHQYKYLNFSSIDMKLKSMTSIDSGEMTFARNTGDFIRIIRLCYLKPSSLTNENENNDNDFTNILNWKPSAPIYLQCKNIVSINNSLKELQQQMNDYLLKVKKHESRQNHYKYYTGGEIERWRFICADSVAIFTSNTSSSSSSSSSDSRNRRTILMADCDKSFHAITISSNHSNMNRNMLNGINIYYDIGLYGRRPKSNMTLSLSDHDNNNNNNNNGENDNNNNSFDGGKNTTQNIEGQKNSHTNSEATTDTDQSSCLIT